MERSTWSDERLDELARRFEGDFRDLRNLITYLWGSMLVGFLVVIATVLLGHG
jgi:hypothetical protein